jgi:hypothetical protein
VSRASEHDTEASRAGMVGATVIELKGKARDYVLVEFFGEKVPGVRGEVVVQQNGLPEGLDLLPIGSLK